MRLIQPRGGLTSCGKKKPIDSWMCLRVFLIVIDYDNVPASGRIDTPGRLISVALKTITFLQFACVRAVF